MSFRSILSAALQAAGLTLAGFLVPLLGQIAVLFAPVPLIMITVRAGRKPGFIAAGLAAAVIAVAVGGQMVFLLFFLSIGLMAVGTAEAMLRRWRPEQAVLFGGVLPLIAVAALLVPVLIKAGKDPLVLADEHLRTSIIEAQELYTRLGLAEIAQALAAVPERTLYYLVRLSPGIVLTTTLLQAACCFGMARTVLLRKNPELSLPAEPSLATWHAPDAWVWGLITALLLVTSGLIGRTDSAAFLIGLNLTLLSAFVYIAQGDALVEYWLRKLRLSVLLRSIAHTVILTLPPLLAVVIALGVVDIWADFRKVRVQPPAATS